MKNHTLKPLCLAVGLALAGSASALTMDFSGTNFYMKFLDGNQHTSSNASIDTNSGADQGQFTEMNLIFKATISPQVEAGGRIQSRSSAAYWSEQGGWAHENGTADNDINHQSFMKLRGAYIELTPGYNWLNVVHIGSSDWGMFDPFTMGKIKYIDRDNYKGLYFQGPMPGRSSWEFARVSLPEFLGVNFSTGTSPKNQAIYVAQFKQAPNNVKLMEGITYVNNNQLDPTDTNPLNGTNLEPLMKSTILSLKADTSFTDGLDFRGALHHSIYNVDTANVLAGTTGTFCYLNGGCGSTSNAYLTTGVFGYSMTPGGDVNGNALKLDLDWRPAGADNFSINYQYFNIGAGYVSVGGARRESDVLLTEGSEAAWYGWGHGNQWLGGRANDMQQVAVIQVDNGYTDFDETGAESSIGWKGNTFKFNYQAADTPMSLELTKVGYNTNWQNYGGNAAIYDVGHGQGTYDVYQPNQDRSTNIAAFKLNHMFQVMGGLDTNFKYKYVSDKDGLDTTTSADDRDVRDNGASISVGNQLHAHLYGTLMYGRYIRDIKVGGVPDNNSKSIYGVRFAYNLPGFEFGMLTQWIYGNGDPNLSGTTQRIQQYRMKSYAQVNF
ncbi:MAG TPA: hypothetical protein VMJ33_07540 [Gallionella sp.]|nr:hypothetical protein [Gallionella sp.]